MFSKLSTALLLLLLVSSGAAAPKAERGYGTCGKTLVMFILAVCGEACQPNTEINIVDECKKRLLSEEEVKRYCCPN